MYKHIPTSKKVLKRPLQFPIGRPILFFLERKQVRLLFKILFNSTKYVETG